jgi:hypothetical protein
MERKISPRRNFTGPIVRLTKEDLDEILDIFKANHLGTVIEDEESTYNSLDELKHYHGEKLGCVRFIGSTPYSVFEINKTPNRRVTLSTSNIDGWSEDFKRIENIIEKRSRFGKIV